MEEKAYLKVIVDEENKVLIDTNLPVMNAVHLMAIATRIVIEDSAEKFEEEKEEEQKEEQE